MKKFITPVSMKVTQEQYEQDLRQALIDLGYKPDAFGNLSNNPILATNFRKQSDKYSNHHILVLEHLDFQDRTNIDTYNPELFLALAAMQSGSSYNDGEYLKCVKTTGFSQTVDKFYKVGNRGLINSDHTSHPHVQIKGGHDLTNYFVKATVSELIAEFGTKQQVVEQNVYYKLTATNYIAAVKELTGLSDPTRIEKDSSAYEKLKNAGVLDKWFEVITKPIFKEGDLVMITHYQNGDKVGTIRKIKRVVDSGTRGGGINFYDTNFGANGDCIRLLTPQEMEEYNKTKLPVIHGYEGKLTYETVSYGCNSFSFSQVRELYTVLKRMNMKGSITLNPQGNEFQVTMTQLEQIYNQIK